MKEYFFMPHKSASSPYINHFLQPDTIIPDYTNPQAFNRYAYVANNPINLNDPTGHCSQGGDDWCFENSALSKGKSKGGDSDANDRQIGRNNALINSIGERYKWNLGSDTWTYDELSGIYQAGSHIESYVNGITGGKGLVWMLAYMGGTTFKHGGMPGGGYSFVTGSTIHVDDASWHSGKDWNTIVHELGHVWDNRSASDSVCDAAICGGGNADLLTSFLGGHAYGIRFLNGTSGIPEEYQIGDYGKKGTAEYYADAFRYMIYDPSVIPSIDIVDRLESYIRIESSDLP